MFAFTFPGQGSQTLGMGKALADAFPVAREVFQEVDEALSRKLSAIMWGEDQEALTLTENAQPAIMAASIAAIRVLENEGGVKLADKASYMAGHSLGEYSALCAAGTFSLSDTARLLDIRGKAMQSAVPVGEGAMAALLGLEMDQVEELVKKASASGAVCELANDNAPGQIVISGHKAGVEKAIEIAKEMGAKRALPLPVSAPFHSSLMAPAAQKMDAALAAVQINAPIVPLLANVTAAETSDAATIHRQLVEQVTARVRWRESIIALRGKGVGTFLELGTGKVLSGLAKRIDKDAETLNLGQPEELDGVIATLNG